MPVYPPFLQARISDLHVLFADPDARVSLASVMNILCAPAVVFKPVSRNQTLLCVNDSILAAMLVGTNQSIPAFEASDQSQDGDSEYLCKLHFKAVDGHFLV